MVITRTIAVNFKFVTIVPVQAIVSTEPKKTLVILVYAADLAIRKAFLQTYLAYRELGKTYSFVN